MNRIMASSNNILFFSDSVIIIHGNTLHSHILFIGNRVLLEFEWFDLHCSIYIF